MAGESHGTYSYSADRTEVIPCEDGRGAGHSWRSHDSRQNNALAWGGRRDFKCVHCSLVIAVNSRKVSRAGLIRLPKSTRTRR